MTTDKEIYDEDLPTFSLGLPKEVDQDNEKGKKKLGEKKQAAKKNDRIRHMSLPSCVIKFVSTLPKNSKTNDRLETIKKISVLDQCYNCQS